jgi:hypothetical protein
MTAAKDKPKTEEIAGPPLAPPGDDGTEVNPMPHQDEGAAGLVCPICALSACHHNLPYVEAQE